MFIRRARTRSGPDGTAYHTFRLVRSQRVGSQVRQRTLLNLGRHVDLPKEHWPQLCRRIEEILSVQSALLECPLEVQQRAESLAARLLARDAAGPDRAAEDDVQSVRLSPLR